MSDWAPDVARLQAREDEEWLKVERAYAGRLLAYAHRRVGDRQAAEDVVQETLLGAVRGIEDFDPVFTFEQYLFGICKNRTIDHLRRRKARTMQLREEGDGPTPIENLARETETPSAIVRGRELSDRAQDLYAEILREWVEETWREGEFLGLGGRVWVRAGEAHGEDTPAVLVEVGDTGIGIAPEHHDLVFREFAQVDSSAARQHHGTGLGLTIARKLVDQHEGRIWLESSLGGGSRFYFTIPRGRVD
jgi:RNA polymerase sigma factor (sigma-70 family)